MENFSSLITDLLLGRPTPGEEVCGVAILSFIPVYSFMNPKGKSPMGIARVLEYDAVSSKCKEAGSSHSRENLLDSVRLDLLIEA